MKKCIQVEVSVTDTEVFQQIVDIIGKYIDQLPPEMVEELREIVGEDE